MYVSLSNLLRKAVGDYRHNKSAAFVHGVRVLTTAIIWEILVLAGLAHMGLVRPLQFLQAAGYGLLLLAMDYAMVSDLAFAFRFVAPDLFGFLSFSMLVSAVTGVGALSIAWRWHRAR